MKYSLMLSMIFYICGCFYMIFGAYTIVVNVKSYVNKLFVILTSSMAVWAFSFSIATSAPTLEVSVFWRCVAVFGWGVFYSLLLHFVLILTKTESRLNKRIMFAMIYLPAFINVILYAPFGYLGEKQYQMVRTDFGWVNISPSDMGDIWFIAYYAVFLIASIVLLIRWWIKIKPGTRLKRQATYFLASVLIPVFLGIATETLPAALGKNSFPQLTIVFTMVPVTTLFLASKKFGLLLERKKEAILSLETVQFQNIDRLRLFQVSAAIYAVAAALSLLGGYFGTGDTLSNELFLAAAILFTGLLTRLIPTLTKNHTVQNTMFLAVSTLGMLFFLKIRSDTGASTVWATYILFLLYTVILDSKIHASIFVILTVAIQIVFWMFYPEVPIIINRHEYITRIFIIVCSYFVIRYLTNEYASKLRGYQRFSKEQEVLEKISTNFISVNNENVKEKIDEMFQLSVETIDVDQVYLVGLSADCEDAMILNAYTMDKTIASLPFRPGIKFEAEALPVTKPLIARKQLIAYEDITNIPVKEERTFFESRGIKSCCALPIILDDKDIVGMLVVEDHKKANLQVRENQLYFLGIIANMLGDTRKKTLYEEQLYKNAYFDESTKLANRNMLVKRLEQSLSGRNESEKLVIFDVELDNLRMINDTFGHNIGEQIIVKSASVLENLMKEGCEIARVGEGKFIIVMPIAETLEQIEECARKILDAFSDPILPKEGIEAIFVTAHVGISMYPEDGKDAGTLLRNADLAGYEAKSSDNKIVFCSDQLKNRMEENTVLTNKLFQSLQNKEFSLEFQPQINCETGKPVGVEALLRWTTEDNKRIPPDVFIPILEQTGLIHEVGLWVLEQALSEYNRLVGKGFPPLRISVNLSVAQFRKDDFVRNVAKIIEESGVNPNHIELEITESMLSENFADTIEKLSQLKDLGINIAIDDFGKGYSSLHRLELVPFNRIKIDKSIVDDITLKGKKVVIVKTIVALAKALMADITAEGVETKEQLDFLKGMCDEIQGYYFSKPLPAEALEEFLSKLQV